jgi:hypothetical protein
MRGVITSPEKDVWLDNISNKFQHVIQSSWRQVTLVFTKWAGLARWVSWEAIILTAAQESTTL